MFELLDWQIIVVGLVASVLVQLIRFIGEKMGKPVNKVLIQWLVFGISLALGLWWGSYEFPAWPVFGGPDSLLGFVEFFSAVVVLIGKALGVAYVIYNVLLKKVFDAIEPLRL